jgi:hypothetical protein
LKSTSFENVLRSLPRHPTLPFRPDNAKHRTNPPPPENPPVIQEPAWNSPRTRELAQRACFNCHSDQTKWPWYADLAPMSWVVQQDVVSARTVINFSEWNRTYELASYSGLSITGGSMPPSKYEMAHPEADLTPTEQQELVDGLNATLK